MALRGKASHKPDDPSSVSELTKKGENTLLKAAPDLRCMCAVVYTANTSHTQHTTHMCTMHLSLTNNNTNS